MKKISLLSRVVLFFIAVDFLLLFIHFMVGARLWVFDLDAEMNVPTIYQGLKLIFASGTVLAIIVTIFARIKKVAWVLVPYMFCFMFLALDEVAQIHEGVYAIFSYWLPNKTMAYQNFFIDIGYRSNYWLLLYMPIILGAIIYFVYFLRYVYIQKVTSRYLAIAAVILFVLTVSLELFTTQTGDFVVSSSLYRFLMPLEELAEMLGVTIFIAFNLIWVRKNLTKIGY